MSFLSRPPAAVRTPKNGLVPQMWAAKRDENVGSDKSILPSFSLSGSTKANWDFMTSLNLEGSGMKPQRPQSALVCRRSATASCAFDAQQASDKSPRLRTLNVDFSEKTAPPNSNQVPKVAKTALTQDTIKSSRPLTAIATVSRGLASSTDKAQLEELKKEIRAIVAMMQGVKGSHSGNERLCKETDEALQRSVQTSEAGDVQQAKITLMTMLLQKQEDLGRCVLAEMGDHTEETGGKEVEKATGDRNKPGQQMRFSILRRLVAKARDLGQGLRDTTEQHNAAQLEIQRLTEECSLMRATLLSAHAPCRKSSRPLSAARQRPTDQPDTSPSVCVSCQGSEGRARTAEAECQKLQLINSDLQAKVDELQVTVQKIKSDDSWDRLRRRVGELEKIDSVKTRKINDLEKSLELRGAERAPIVVDTPQAKAAAAIKPKETQPADEPNDTTLKLVAAQANALELEKLLAASRERVESLEKKVAECQELLQFGCSNWREKELLANNEELAKSFKDAQDEIRRLEQTLSKEREEAERLRKLLKEQKDEADACSTRLIQQVRDNQQQVRELLASVREQGCELLCKTKELSAMKQIEFELKRRIKELEEGMRDPTATQGTAGARAARETVSAEKELAGDVGGLESYKKEYDELKIARDRELGESELLRAKALELQSLLGGEREGSKGLDAQHIAEQSATLQAKMSKAETGSPHSDQGDLPKRCEALERKLQAVMRKAEMSEQRALTLERSRDETREIEAQFKSKIKGLYDKRVKELVQVQKELEAQIASRGHTKSNNLNAHNISVAGGHTMSPQSRPMTAASNGRRRY